MNLLTLYKKELFSFWRSSKWIWLPIAFALLGVMQPITLYYMADILKIAGGLPEGAIFEIPLPASGEVLVSVLSQYNSVGVVIIVASAMGMIHAERQRGTLPLVMSRPVAAWEYVVSKWAAEITILFVSLLFSYGLAAYYTEILFGGLTIVQIAKSFFVYFIWVMFIVTVTCICSLIFKNNGAIIGVSILIIASLSLLDGIFEKHMKWSPSLLSNEAAILLVEGSASGYFVFNLTSSFTLITLLVGLAIYLFGKQEHA